VLAAAKTIRITIDLPATWAVASEGFGGQEGSTDQAGVSTFPLTLAQPGTVLYGNGGTAANTTYQTMGFGYGSDEIYRDGEAKAAAWLSAAEGQPARDPAGLRSVSSEESGTAVISGFDAAYARYTANETTPGTGGYQSLRYGRFAYYHVDLGGGSALIAQLGVP